MSRRIPLSMGLFAIVDDEDYDALMTLKWYAWKNKYTHYALTMHKIGNNKRITIRMHKFILGTDRLVDHKNRNGLDNRKQNLRLATNSQNCANQRKKKNGFTSIYKGIGWHKPSKKWKCAITVQGITYFLGWFYIEEEAALAYNRAAIKYFGEFASLNDVPEEKSFWNKPKEKGKSQIRKEFIINNKSIIFKFINEEAYHGTPSQECLDWVHNVWRANISYSYPRHHTSPNLPIWKAIKSIFKKLFD